MMRKFFSTLAIGAILFSFQTSLASANDEDIPYLARIPYRIVRGAVNIGLGWTEILLRPIGEHKTESFGEALATGAANGFYRTTAGIYEIVTFWVPDIQMTELYPDWQGWPYIFHWS